MSFQRAKANLELLPWFTMITFLCLACEGSGTAEIGIEGRFHPHHPFWKTQFGFKRVFFRIGGECVRDFGKLLLSFIKNKWSLNFKGVLRCGYYRRARRRCTPTPPRVKNLALVFCAIMAIKHRRYCKLKTDGWDRLGMSCFVSPNLSDGTWKNGVSPSAPRGYFYTYLQRKRV